MDRSKTYGLSNGTAQNSLGVAHTEDEDNVEKPANDVSKGQGSRDGPGYDHGRVLGLLGNVRSGIIICHGLDASCQYTSLYYVWVDSQPHSIEVLLTHATDKNPKRNENPGGVQPESGSGSM